MWCMNCDKHFPGECTCPDRDERLHSLAQHPNFAYRKCKLCRNHYSLCKCPNPQWTHSMDKSEDN